MKRNQRREPNDFDWRGSRCSSHSLFLRFDLTRLVRRCLGAAAVAIPIRKTPNNALYALNFSRFFMLDRSLALRLKTRSVGLFFSGRISLIIAHARADTDTLALFF